MLRQLARYQAEVMRSSGRPEQVAAAQRLWKARNTKTNATFREVKRCLDAMCAGARRCCYCEDSVADEVEHIKPKSLFLELTFEWENYLYACGPCNGPKGARYGFVQGRHVEELQRLAGDTPPPSKPAALLDPRHEDPLEFFTLDLRTTFLFVPRAKAGTVAHARAVHTLEVLHLNDRDALVRARAAAFSDYLRHVEAYVRAQDDGADQSALALRRRDILSRQHPTVFRGMQRQTGCRQDLATAFQRVPEAIRW
jgi:uncharacterized protein (TIGR02646 family)